MKILKDDTQALQAVVVNTYGPAHLQSTQTDQTFDDLINVGNDFDKSRSDDYFYMRREAFDNDDVKTGMTLICHLTARAPGSSSPTRATRWAPKAWTTSRDSPTPSRYR